MHAGRAPQAATKCMLTHQETSHEDLPAPCTRIAHRCAAYFDAYETAQEHVFLGTEMGAYLVGAYLVPLRALQAGQC